MIVCLTEGSFYGGLIVTFFGRVYFEFSEHELGKENVLPEPYLQHPEVKDGGNSRHFHRRGVAILTPLTQNFMFLYIQTKQTTTMKK